MFMGLGPRVSYFKATAPIRLRLSRAKGFDLQKLSRATNGRAAVNVARPSKWGNCYRAGRDGNGVQCALLFRAKAIAEKWDLTELRGKNLACWCQPGHACHADVLLDLANRTHDL